MLTKLCQPSPKLRKLVNFLLLGYFFYANGGGATCVAPGSQAEDPPNDFIELISHDKTSNQHTGFLKALVRS